MKRELYRDQSNWLVAHTSRRIAESTAFLIQIRARLQETQALIQYAKRTLAESKALLDDEECD